MWLSSLRCIVYGAGIIVCLLINGLLQERIVSRPYGGELFGATAFLVLCTRLAAAMFAALMTLIMPGEMRNVPGPLWKYLVISFSNVGATWCQYEALRYVSFPVLMLGKSSKMMPAMFWGAIISKKRHGLAEWLAAACITGGVAEFLLTGGIRAEHAAGTSVRGLILILVFMELDGFTSLFQERVFKLHKSTKYNQMFYVNFFSSLVSLIALLATMKAREAFGFCGDHPAFVGHAIALSAAGVGGQWFIFAQVKEFGALVFAATVNLRHVVSILASYAAYHHRISRLQVVGLILVFLGLLCKSCSGLSSICGSRREMTPLLLERKKQEEGARQQEDVPKAAV